MTPTSNKVTTIMISVDVMYYICDIPNPYKHICTYWYYRPIPSSWFAPYDESYCRIKMEDGILKAEISSNPTTSWESTGYKHKLVSQPGKNGDLSRIHDYTSWKETGNTDDMAYITCETQKGQPIGSIKYAITNIENIDRSITCPLANSYNMIRLTQKKDER